MIDMHSHIIPGVDDGSKSIEESFNMIVEAKKSGFTDVFLTSHFMTHNFEPSVQELVIWKEKLQEIINKEEIELKLHSGMEVYISNRMQELIEENKILTLNNSRYLLMELPISSSVNYVDYVLYFLQSNFIIPILAHPERYFIVQDNIKLIDHYIEMGALIQCNYGSILGLYGRKAKKVFKKLLKNKKVNFLGSDCHRENTIYKMIPDSVKKIKKIIGEEEFLKISVKNPEIVINNYEWME